MQLLQRVHTFHHMGACVNRAWTDIRLSAWPHLTLLRMRALCYVTILVCIRCVFRNPIRTVVPPSRMEAAKSSIYIARCRSLGEKGSHRSAATATASLQHIVAQSFHGKRTHRNAYLKGQHSHPDRSLLFSCSHGFSLKIRGAAISHIHIWRASTLTHTYTFNDSHTFNISINHSNHIFSRVVVRVWQQLLCNSPKVLYGRVVLEFVSVCVCEFADLQPDMRVCVSFSLPVEINTNKKR